MRTLVYLTIIIFICFAIYFFTMQPKVEKAETVSYSINDRYVDDTQTFKERIEFIVIHFTHGDFEESLHVLTHGPVSTHYLIPETPEHGIDVIYRLVGDDLKAAHAGASFWQGFTRLNSSSLGIELVNLGFEDKPDGTREWYPFTDYQINLLIPLLHDLIAEYDIDPTRIIAHADITQNMPERGTHNTRVDPGPLFPWKRLAEADIGAWYDTDEVNDIIAHITNTPLDIKKLQENLATFGYNITPTGELDTQTTNVIQAFQMHFRPENYSGVPDAQTYAIAENLVSRYF